MKTRHLLIVALFVAATSPTQADIFSPSHSCSKPYKPFQFNDDWEVQRFEAEVRRYKQCITDFVEDQEREIQNHRDAAEEAIDEWNRFVRTELS